MEGDCPLPGEVPGIVDHSNCYLAGVVATIAGIYTIYYFSDTIRKYLIGNFTVSMSVSGGMLNFFSHDKPYHWLLNWCGENLKNLQHYNLNTKIKENDYGKVSEADFKFHPSFGTHVFRYKGQWIKLVRERLPSVKCQDITWESITLTTLKSHASLLQEIMLEAKNIFCKTDESETSFFAISCGDWTSFGNPKKRRELNSVILSKDLDQKIVADIKDFLASEDWYRERGIPYRRGYLFHGPPGCGKSSLIKAIAGEFGMDICMLSLSAKDLTDDGLNLLMNSTPAKSIILLEDIESAFKSRVDADGVTNKEMNLAYEGAGASKVTFRGLLNALDGVASAEGRLIFMTTNYLDRLDPALSRPGRVDVKVLIDLPDFKQVQKMVARFYQESSSDVQKKFADIVKGLKRDASMAMLQGLFMLHKTSVEDALNQAVEYFEQQHFNIQREKDIEKMEMEELMKNCEPSHGK